MLIINKALDVIPFEADHIRKSIYSAAKAVYGQDVDNKKIDCQVIAATVTKKLEALGVEKIGIETVQDLVELSLMENHQYAVAKAFILYREKRAAERAAKNDVISYVEVMNGYLDKSDWRTKENSNVNYSIGGSILHNNSSITANYWLKRIYSPRIADAHKNADIHIHDLGMFEPYCAGHSLRELIVRGITGVADKVSSAPAKHLGTLCQQLVNFLGILQNEWAGAQAFSSVDTYLAPFIKIDNLSYKEVYQCCQTLLYGINTPSRWGCVTPDTEILTKDGWKHYADLKVGDAVYGYDETKQVLVDDAVEKVNVYDYHGDLIHFSGRGTDQLLSPNHKVIRQGYNSAKDPVFLKEEASETYKLRSAFNVPTSGSWDKEDFDISDERLELFAWILAEGTIQAYMETSTQGYAGGKRVLISQSPDRNPQFCKEIERDLDVLGFGYSVYRNESGLGHGVNVYRLNASATEDLIKDLEKGKLPMHVLRNCSRRQVRLFLDTYNKADGSKSRFRITTVDSEVMDNIQELALIAGYSTNVRIRSPEGPYSKLPRFLVAINQKSPGAVSVTKREKVPYDGVIWCPTTGTHNWVARRNGKVFITGNSQAPFSNFTHDWTVPADMKDKKAIVGGVEQDFTYGDCQGEMDLFNNAFFTLFMEGDAQGRSFQYPIPTINITKEFWEHCPENQDLLFRLTSKFGTPYFQNFISSDMDPADVRSMCCRLRLDKRELRKRGGGLFGSAELTGSVGVVTLNLPRLGYLANDEADFYARLDDLMDIARDSLEIKRKVLAKNLVEGLYPYTKAYVSSFDNFFSTIGLVGMNEACRNLFGSDVNIGTEQGKQFAIDVLNHMRERIAGYQVETGNLYNLESTPAESTCYRLALHDKKKYPDIIVAGSGEPYYTNSSNLPVGYTDDPWVAIEHQEAVQTLYTGGCVTLDTVVDLED